MFFLYGALALGVGWFLYSFGLVQAGYNNSELAEEVELITQHNQEIEKENKKLLEQIAVLERSRQVESEAYTELDNNLKELQQEILELKEEAAFYRGIVSPSESARGLNIQSFKVDKTQEDQVYRFKLVLTQVMKKDKAVSGEVKMVLEGIKDGVPKQIPLNKLTGGAPLKLDLKFKYFQTIEGNIVLPEGLLPSRIIVDVLPRGGKLLTLKKSFDWTAILN